jgi:diadenosine tetraphosphate (Ap4A) HIT family hydrolase
MTCYLCPDDWRFVYSHGIARARGKADPYIQVLKSLHSVDQLKPEIRVEFEGVQHFLYKDENFVIVYDAEEDMPLHLLFIPVEHIENFKILDRIDLLKEMLLAGEFLVKNSSSLKEAYLSISSKKEPYQGDYFRHFHLHLQSQDVLDKQEILSLLTPRFYK